MSEAASEDALQNFLAFREENLGLDPQKLVMKWAQDPMRKRWAEALQVERRLRGKLPEAWFEQGFQCHQSKWAEQCSSFTTARFKSMWLRPNGNLYDLTGGLGIDSIAFALRGLAVHYTELDAELASLSAANFRCLQLNIQVQQGDGLQLLPKQIPSNTYVYLDPDRRPDERSGKRSRSLDQMSPNWDSIQDKMPLGGHWLIKLSPLHDLQEIIRRMGKACTLHLLEHQGECKEVLLEWHEEITRTTVHVHEVEGKWNAVQWPSSAIGKQPHSFAESPKQYLYDPSPAMNKSMAWDALADAFGLEKIAPNTHLYTADQLLTAFPGRIFQVTESLHKKNRPIAASIISKNFGTSAEELRKSWKLQEDEEVFVICFRDQKHQRLQLLSKRLR